MSRIEMKAEYGGYVVKWQDYPEGFIIYKDDVELKKKVKTLEDCEKWIDAKNKQVFKRVHVLYSFGYNRPLVPAEATSIVEENSVWVVSGKERSKARMSDVWLDTDSNRDSLQAIREKNKQINVLNGEIEEIKKNAERLTADMMV